MASAAKRVSRPSLHRPRVPADVHRGWARADFEPSRGSSARPGPPRHASDDAIWFIQTGGYVIYGQAGRIRSRRRRRFGGKHGELAGMPPRDMIPTPTPRCPPDSAISSRYPLTIRVCTPFWQWTWVRMPARGGLALLRSLLYPGADNGLSVVHAGVAAGSRLGERTSPQIAPTTCTCTCTCMHRPQK